jgi:hypothetical protein
MLQPEPRPERHAEWSSRGWRAPDERQCCIKAVSIATVMSCRAMGTKHGVNRMETYPGNGWARLCKTRVPANSA